MQINFKVLIAFAMAWLLAGVSTRAQCEPGQLTLSMEIYTDPWGYETYWEIVPGTNACGDGTIAWGSNLEAVGCGGGGEANAYGTETAYPSNTVIQVDDICLNDGEFYTLYFVDDWGDGGLWFEMFVDGSLVGLYQGTGIGNAWTFQAGVSPLGPYDSPCNAAVITPGLSSAFDLNNVNCYTQLNEIHPFHGHCTASGTWCADEVNKTVWARFTVPDDGSYEISTVHNGTYINTQMAVWVTDDCSSMENFILVAANDDYWGDSGISECAEGIPSCVDRASAAFENVISELPQCCESGWTQDCQDLYDTMDGACLSGINTCSFLLEGFDSYGDGWNDGFITVTINGVSEDYTFYEGNYANWPLELATGDEVSITFTPGGWPEEVTVALQGPDGAYDLYVQPVNNDPLIYSDVIDCSGEVTFHLQASRCYVNCLPAGTECFIQIDGYAGESGEIVLSVKPFEDEPQIFSEVNDQICPAGVGTIPQGLIVTFIEGWGLNYLPTWTSNNGYSSNDYHPYEVNNGIYNLIAIDACGNQLEATYEVSGPDPFLFASTAQPTCPEFMNGSVSTQFAGGTAPYVYFWLMPDSSVVEETSMSNLPPGVYHFYVIDDVDCAIIETVEVEELPAPVFELGENFTVCDEFMVQIEGPESMVDYNWSDGTQTQYAVLTDDQFEIGTHLISLDVFNEFGCGYSDSLLMEVIECTTVQENIFGTLNLYPQPANQVVMLKGLPAFDLNLKISNLAGETISEYNSGGHSNFEIPTAKLSTGLYILTIAHNIDIKNLKLVIAH